MRKSQWLVYLAMALTLCLPVPSLAEDWVVVDIGETTVRWTVQGDFELVVLTVVLPNSKVIRREVKAGEPVVFEVDRSAKDGTYTYEIRGIQHFDDSVRKELEAARRSGDEFDVIESLKDAGRLPRDPAVRSGAFSVKDGVLVRPDLREDDDEGAKPTATAPRQTTGKGIGIITAADQVIPDDLIVQGSECVGFDCVNNENFGFDTIRLKENNLRIHFDDTSTLPGFPANDWRLIANDSASGGASKFSIEDSTGARTPFTIRAGASTNSIFVDSTGRVGFRTSTPVLDLHVNTSNTPALRLEQNNSGGFTAQTWDIGANEANFFVRSVTTGSQLSLRIRPGAPTSSLDISADGDIGIGTGSPDSKLHISSSAGGDAHLHIEDTNGTAALRTMVEIENNGASRLNFVDNNAGATWGLNNNGGNLNMIKSGAGANAFSLTGNGTLTVIDLIESSDRDLKTDIVPVQPAEILAKVGRLPLSTWRFKSATDHAIHMGPMAQDFSALFGLGHDDKHIKALDVAGVSLAAVQALHQQVSAKDAEIAALKQRNDDLAQRLAALEALVSSLASAPK